MWAQETKQNKLYLSKMSYLSSTSLIHTGSGTHPCTQQNRKWCLYFCTNYIVMCTPIQTFATYTTNKLSKKQINLQMCNYVQAQTHTSPVLSSWWWSQAMRTDEQDLGRHALKERICCPPSSHLHLLLHLASFTLQPSFHFSFTLLSTYFSAAGPSKSPSTPHPSFHPSNVGTSLWCHRVATYKTQTKPPSFICPRTKSPPSLFSFCTVSPVQLFTNN